MSTTSTPASIPKTAYLGPAASYSHQAALACFNKDEYDLEPQESIKDVFSSIQSATATYGVVPFENSTYGTVTFTLDLLVDRESKYPDLLVCAELYLPVHHCLVVVPQSPTTQTPGPTSSAPTATPPPPPPPPTSTPIPTAAIDSPPQPETENIIKTIYSHPAAFGQCLRYLSTHHPSARKIEVSSTSKAAELVATSPNSDSDPRSTDVIAAISSKLAAQMHGLRIAAEGIQDSDDNATRFFIIRNRHTSPSPSPSSFSDISSHGNKHSSSSRNHKKSLITFSLPHSPPGALADTLNIFRNHSLNLTGINSRPSLESKWRYVFLVEVLIPLSPPKPGEGMGMGMGGEGGIDEAFWEQLGEKTKGWKWLGSWEDGGG
ncbi:MAG: hypothetical protein LQ350_005777 [Teloschistes chrysophthalmus]|nr:MAG: hypothetical protein LQ350_005777 [Niorma chrysophthalma]